MIPASFSRTGTDCGRKVGAKAGSGASFCSLYLRKSIPRGFSNSSERQRFDGGIMRQTHGNHDTNAPEAKVLTNFGKETDACRSGAIRRRKYVFTDQIDQFVREIYLNRRGSKSRPGIGLLAKKVGMPHWALKKRARELGLARTKELPWSERELEILARYRVDER